MNPTLKNVLAVLVGWFVGGLVNWGLIQLGHTLMPIDGVDPSDMEALAEVMPTLEAKYFIFPFLAHALGTLIGAAIAFKMGASKKMRLAMIVGFVFLLGGIAAAFMIPAPTWFVAADLILAYIPMAWLGSKFMKR